MAEEFPATGICGGNWWNFPKNDHHMGMNYGSWLVTDIAADLKPRSCKLQQDSIINTINNTSLVFQDSQKPAFDSDDHSSNVLMDSSPLQMMGFGVSSSSSSSSPSSDWSQTLLRGNSMLEEEMNSQIQKDWSPKSFTGTQEDSSSNTYKAINHQDFSLDQQQRLNPSYGAYESTIPLIQSLFEPSDPDHHHRRQSFYNNQTAMNYSTSPQNYGTTFNELSPSWPNLASFLKPSLPRQPGQNTGGSYFSDNTPFWNATAEFLPSSQSQVLLPSFDDKPNCTNLIPKVNNEAQVRDSGCVVKKGSEPALKRPRIETPLPLPTFKVRKEKLGDRITALQQLVSPFGKTDTASVLHEAIEYIKFLHDQVNVLSTPYLNNGNPKQGGERGGEGLKEEDLKSRGLCLVPISSTFPVAHETTADFWTPTFGGTFSVTHQSNQDAIDDYNFNTKRR